MKSIQKAPAKTAGKKTVRQSSSARPTKKAAAKSPAKAAKNKKETAGGFPKQKQAKQPGSEAAMKPNPTSKPILSPGKKLEGKTLVISGGDSGIGKAIALLFAEHGANIVVAYLNEHQDAKKTEEEIIDCGVQTLFLAGDITQQSFCQQVIEEALLKFGKIDILINNAAVQYPQEDPANITAEQLVRTFSTNVFAAFYFMQAALPFMKKGSCIINTTSVTAYRGSKSLVDYAATKGALVAFTRSLSSALTSREIRVNAVAPGPIWTPLIPASFPKEKVKKFGTDVPMGRAGQPQEVAPCYLFLASDEASYITGQVIHPNGGEIING